MPCNFERDVSINNIEKEKEKEEKKGRHTCVITGFYDRMYSLEVLVLVLPPSRLQHHYPDYYGEDDEDGC